MCVCVCVCECVCNGERRGGDIQVGVRGRLVNRTAWTVLQFCKKAQNNQLLFFGRFLIFFFFFVSGSPPCWEKKNPTRQTNP